MSTPSRWTARSIWMRARKVIHEEGLRTLWFKVLGETVYRRVFFVERPLDQPGSEVPCRLPLMVELLAETEVDEYCNLHARCDPAEIRRRLEEGERCFVVRLEGRLVHTGWAATGKARIEYLSREIDLEPGEAYVYESFTLPQFRGQNLAPARIMAMVRFFRKAGFQRLVAVIVPENKVAFRPSQKAGYRAVGTMGYVKLGPWRHDFFRKKPKPQMVTSGVSDADYWGAVARRLGKEPHYLDPFLGRLKRQVYLDLIERWASPSAKARVLKTDLFEEAMGPDAFLTDLGGHESLVVGIDVSGTIAARARGQDVGRQACYAVADVRRLPFAGESFALVVSPSTLDHFPNPADLANSLQELGRVMEFEGQLIITLDNRQNLFDPLLRVIARVGWMPFFLGRSYRAAELRSALVGAGFAVEETTAILHNPRLVAVGAVRLANALRWPALTRLIHRSLCGAQRLERSRLRYRTGSFVAAKAVRPTPVSVVLTRGWDETTL